MKTLLFDFSRVLLHPRDKNYTGSLNGLYRELLKKETHNFFDHFALNTELLDYLKTIKKYYPLYILTSDTIQNAPEIRERLEETFDTIFSAKDMSLTKKDPAIYHHISEILQKNPSDIIFIDDTKENITAAQQAGLKTILYQTNNVLIKKLEQL